MARIPTITRQQSLPQTTGVPSAPRVTLSDNTGQTAAQFGDVLKDIGERQMKAKADAMVTESYVNATLKIDELKNSIANNKLLSYEQGVPGATVPTADAEDVRGRLQQIYESASEGLAPYAKEQFTKKHSLLAAKAEIEIRRDQINRDNARLVAQNERNLNIILKTNTEDGNEAKWASDLEAGLQSIESLEINGQIDPRQAETRKTRFRDAMNKLKGDRLRTDVTNFFNDGINGLELGEENVTRKMRSVKLMDALDKAVKFGAMKREERAKTFEDYLNKIDLAEATLQLADNPYTLKEQLKTDKYQKLSGLQKARLQIQSDSRINALERTQRVKQNALEKKFVNTVKDSLFILNNGGNLDPSDLAKITPEKITENVSDPEEAAILINAVEDAQEFSVQLQSIQGNSASENRKLLEEANAQINRQGNVALASQNVAQKNRISAALASDIAARRKDTAAYVIQHDEQVNATFAAYNKMVQNPDADPMQLALAYEDYALARDGAYAEMEFQSFNKRKFPESFIKTQIDFFQNANPEMVVQRFDALQEQLGSDFNSLLKEMDKEGISEEVAALAVVDRSENSQALNDIVNIIKGGGMTELIKGSAIEPTIITEITTNLNEELRDTNLYAVAGGSQNNSIVNNLNFTARMLAINHYRNNRNQNKAIDYALKVVIHDNYTIINHPKLKGIIPKGSLDARFQDKPDELFQKLGQWLTKEENYKNIKLSQFTGIGEDQQRSFMWSSQNWTMDPEGNFAELRSQNGTPVIDKDNHPVVVRISDLFSSFLPKLYTIPQ